jgi:hypothetical protein
MGRRGVCVRERGTWHLHCAERAWAAFYRAFFCLVGSWADITRPGQMGVSRFALPSPPTRTWPPPILLLGAVGGGCVVLYLYSGVREEGYSEYYLSSSSASRLRLHRRLFVLARLLRRLRLRRTPITIDIRVYFCISTYMCTRNIDLDLDINPTSDAPLLSIHPAPTPQSH